MQTECTPLLFEFEPVERKKVVAGFDGGTITSDAGGLLLGQLDRGLGLIQRMAGCFTERRDPRLLEHTVESMVGQRVFGLALGYEDLNQLRLWFSSMAYVLLNELRRIALRHTRFAWMSNPRLGRWQRSP